MEKIIYLIFLALLTIPLADRWTLDLGPSLDAFLSYATIAGRHFSETDYRAGGRAALEYRLDDSWKVGLSYRYSPPPGRQVNSLGLGIAREFSRPLRVVACRGR